MISPTARQILAERYTARSTPWFAHDILKGDSRQFDAPLEAITALLATVAAQGRDFALYGFSAVRVGADGSVERIAPEDFCKNSADSC